LTRLQALRNCLTDVFLKAQDSHKHAISESAIDDCYEYHAVLLEFEKRGFPTTEPTIDGHEGEESTSSSIIRLTWKGAWEPHRPERHGTLLWERAVITYNLVALLSEKANSLDMTNRDECKQAVKLFQDGASLLHVLRELTSTQDFATVDLSTSHLQFWEALFLAQAQLCIYRMVSISADDSKHGTLSVLAMAVYELFNDALKASQDPRLQSELPHTIVTEYGGYCKATGMLHAAKASYHQSCVHRLNAEWGKEIARIQETIAKLESCQSFCNTLDEHGVVSYTLRDCRTILPVVKDRLVEADNDNYKIYQDPIPKPSDLAEIPSKTLAKITPTLPQHMLVPSKPLFTSV